MIDYTRNNGNFFYITPTSLLEIHFCTSLISIKVQLYAFEEYTMVMNYYYKYKCHVISLCTKV